MPLLDIADARRKALVVRGTALADCLVIDADAAPAPDLLPARPSRIYERRSRLRTEALVGQLFVAPDTQNAAAAGQQAVAHQLVQRRQQLAAHEIAGRADDDEQARRPLVSHAIFSGPSLCARRYGRTCRSVSRIADPPRMRGACIPCSRSPGCAPG